jgi:hypothetical protein
MRRIENWIELVGVIGLLIGIGLVILQLQQNETLLSFQIASDLRVNRDNDRNTIIGEQYATTLAKLQTAPEKLTDAELVQFDVHARSLTSELDFRRLLAAEGIFKGDWKNWLRAETCDLFNNPIGRAWLDMQDQTTGQSTDQELVDELEQRLIECASRPSFLQSVRDKQTK